MKRLLFVFLIPVLFSANKHQYAEHYVVFYNCENFFDTLDDPHKSDNEFLPDAKRKWDTKRYKTKLDRISQVIDSIPGNLPDLVGLCEVEDKSCLKDLVQHPTLQKGNYDFLITDGQDVRNIDVALLYDKSVFKLQAHRFINATNPETPQNKTRDILLAHFKYWNENVYVFVVHFPSRIGGIEKTEPKRLYAASRVRSAVDSLQKLQSNAKILVMGDMNDWPKNESIEKILQAKNDISKPGELINHFYKHHLNGEGTYYWADAWGVFDQILVTQSLKGGPHQLSYDPNSAAIYKGDFLLKANKEGVKIPKKTYNGTKYTNGYSDHLPVYLKLFIN